MAADKPRPAWRIGRTDKDVIRALEENNYDIYDTAKAMGYTRPSALRDRIRNNPKLNELVEGRPQKEMSSRISRVTQEDFIEAIYRARGMKTVIAKILDLNVSNVYDRIKRHPELQEHVRIASEQFKDVAETKLFELVEKGDFEAIKFYLSRQARDRGYGDKLEFSAHLDMTNSWNLQVLGVEELLALESIAKKALPLPQEESEDVIEGRFIEVTTQSDSA